MGDIMLHITNLAQRMLFVNHGCFVLVWRLAAAILLRYETALKTGRFVLVARGDMEDKTYAKEKPLKEDIWRRQTCQKHQKQSNGIF